MSHFFRFEAFDLEIHRKIATLKLSPEDLLDEFFELLRKLGARADEIEALRDLCEHLCSLSFDRVYSNYLTHPIRLAGSLALCFGAGHVDEVKLALVHNVIEAGLSAEVDPAGKYLNAHLWSWIRILTIDRSRERDVEYLAGYYDGVSQAGLLELKALDKLDNLLSYPLFDMESFHYDVVRHHVCPKLGSQNARLREYLEGLIEHLQREQVGSRFRGVRQLNT